MNSQLDLEIKRAFDELVAAAPPPPPVDAGAPASASRGSGSRRRLLAVAASVVILGGGLGLSLALRERPETLTTTTASAPEPLRDVAPPNSDAHTEVTAVPGSELDVPRAPANPSGATYEVVATPPLPVSTEPVDTGVEPFDGVYFAFLHEGPLPEQANSLRFDVVQILSGQDCVEPVGGEAACVPFVIDPEAPTVQVDLDVIDVPVSVRDANSDLSHRISGVELRSLITGNLPAPTAPAGFVFSGGSGFLLTYDSGSIVSIDQPA